MRRALLKPKARTIVRYAINSREVVMMNSGSVKHLIKPLAIRLSEQTTLAKSLVMAGHPFDRRDFLKVLGWGGAAVALSGCGNGSVEDGKETVVSYVETNDYMIPSILSLIHISEPT